jgi:hypothetical protein
VTPTGAARADELLACLVPGGEPAAGAVIERTDLEIEDELTNVETQGPAGAPPPAGPSALPTGPAGDVVVRPAPPPAPPAARWGASPNGPVVE